MIFFQDTISNLSEYAWGLTSSYDELIGELYFGTLCRRARHRGIAIQDLFSDEDDKDLRLFCQITMERAYLLLPKEAQKVIREAEISSIRHAEIDSILPKLYLKYESLFTQETKNFPGLVECIKRLCPEVSDDAVDKAMQFVELKNRALVGNIEALISLGEHYYYGIGVELDYQRAIECYLDAAEQGAKDALFFLGYMYSKGEGVEQDCQLAREWYHKAAKQGHTEALLLLKELNNDI